MSNVTINILATISLVWIAVLIIAVIIKIAVMISENDTAKLYVFLKKFKKGSCFLVYFAAIPLYFCALYYGGSTVGGAIFTAIDDSISLIVLSFEFDTVAPLAAVNAYYGTVVYICFVSVILNAILFAVSLLWFRIKNFICKYKALRQKKEVYIIVGYNENNKKIIDSISKKGEKDSIREEIADKKAELRLIRNVKTTEQEQKIKLKQELKQLKLRLKKCKGEFSILLVRENDLREKDALNLLMLENGSGYTGYESAEFYEKLEKLLGKRKLWRNRAVNIIINCENENEDLFLTQEFCKFLNNHKDISHSIMNRDGINGYVFCDPQNTSTFNFYVESTHGAIQYLNKYRLVAMNFISNYPLTKYMTENEIDEQFPALKENVEVNFVMIGFGKLNRQLFHTSISTQQFLSIKKDGKIKEKPVHYCIYDKTDSNADLILNHNYYRYVNFEQQNRNNPEFLPLPEMPADVQFNKMSISDGEFYNRLHNDLNGTGKYSYIVISYGTDMQNLDFGQKLAAKLKEWNLQDKVKLFVKIRNHKIVKGSNRQDIIFFGDENEAVYNINAILHEGIELLAKNRSLLYSRENAKKQGKIIKEEILENQAAQEWYNQSQCQREANIYACMSLRSKLNLLGFDIQKRSETDNSKAAEEFMHLYQSGDTIEYEKSKEKAEKNDDKKIKKHKFFAVKLKQSKKEAVKQETVYRKVKYNNEDFNRNSVRKYCAVIEHQRWNANYISWGFVPATKHEIATCKENGKDFAIRRHGCLTTFDGLKAFREIVAKKNLGLKYDADLEDCDSTRSALENADVIRYDYQIMDDVLWLLDNSDYALVKKEIIKRCAD